MARHRSTDPAIPREQIVAALKLKLAPTAPRALSRRLPLPTGIPSLDAALPGGLPRAQIVEVSGAGRLSLGLLALAHATHKGHRCAFVDTVDGLDAASAERAGVAFQHLLWVRLPGADPALQAADLLLGAGGFALVVLYLEEAAPRWPAQGPVRLHHRCERSSTALLVLSEVPTFGSAAAVAVKGVLAGAAWVPTPGRRLVFTGHQVRFELVRSRLSAPGAAAAVGFRK